MQVARRRARQALDATEAASAAWRVRRRGPEAIRICWDLDNTLVGSGALLETGQDLTDAIVAAAPMPGGVALLEALRTQAPTAAHVVLSARRRALRSDTLAWLRRHDLRFGDVDVLLVPTAHAKPRVWRALARDARLVIVDDLSHGHHAGAVRPYDDLVTEARRVAAAFVGLEELDRLGADPGLAPTLAADVLRTLEPPAA